VAFDLDTYKRVTGRLDVDGIDFDAFRAHPLDERHLRCLRYMHDVEEHTSCYLRNLLNTRAHHDPEITAFLTMWNFEELWHGEALGRVIAAHDEPGTLPRVAAMRRRLGRRIGNPVAWMTFSAVTRHFLAVHMTFGVINEWTTQAGYARLRAVADHPTLDAILGRVMRQEGRHIDYYLTRANELLGARTSAQRTTRRMLRVLWSPVGAKVMPTEETRHLVRTLFGDGEGRSIAARIDRRIDRLPGLDGMGLMAGAVERWAA